MDWNQVKQKGSTHYQTGEIEPIDLYKSMGCLRDWCIVEICQHALRNRAMVGVPICKQDLEKIIHLAEILLAAQEEWDKEK